MKETNYLTCRIRLRNLNMSANVRIPATDVKMSEGRMRRKSWINASIIYSMATVLYINGAYSVIKWVCFTAHAIPFPLITSHFLTQGLTFEHLAHRVIQYHPISNKTRRMQSAKSVLLSETIVKGHEKHYEPKWWEYIRAINVCWLWLGLGLGLTKCPIRLKILPRQSCLYSKNGREQESDALLHAGRKETMEPDNSRRKERVEFRSRRKL
jgi:hypothetical protein